MDEPGFTENHMRLAEEHYQRGNLQEAIKVVNALTFNYPNTSTNHRKISQALVAYRIHWRQLGESATHYDILRISNPFCSHQMIQRKYRDLVVKLCPGSNRSVAAKSAFEIVNTAWKVLSDPERRREYNVREVFGKRIDVIEEDETSIQTVKEGKRHCVESIVDDFSDSD